MNRNLTALLLLGLSGIVRADDGPKPVKVFVLAGQSNMEGKAKMSLVEYHASRCDRRVSHL